MWNAAENPDSTNERKPSSHSSLGSKALVIRDTDAMRDGIRGLLREVSMQRLVVRLPQTIPVGEQVKLKLRNLVQRFGKETRGVVRKIARDTDFPDESLLEVELYLRLTPLEVSLLRMGIRDDSHPHGAKWLV